MKRSHYIALLGMGASAVVLTACEDPDAVTPVKAYASVAECAADGFDTATCQKAQAAAEDGYDQAYPRYGNQFACEANAGEGRCERDYPNSRHASWRPSMIGFIMPGPGVQPQAIVARAGSPTGRATAAGMPLSRNGSATVIAVRAGAAPTASQIVNGHPEAATRTVARGGFGATAARIAASGSSGRSFGG